MSRAQRAIIIEQLSELHTLTLLDPWRRLSSVAPVAPRAYSTDKAVLYHYITFRLTLGQLSDIMVKASLMREAFSPSSSLVPVRRRSHTTFS